MYDMCDLYGMYLYSMYRMSYDGHILTVQYHTYQATTYILQSRYIWYGPRMRAAEA